MSDSIFDPTSTNPRDAGADMPSDALAEAQKTIDLIRARVQHDVMGRNEVIDLVLIALMSGGHVLLEDYPGSGKTTLAKALGHALGEASAREDLANFRRIQFTPDLLPSDVTV